MPEIVTHLGTNLSCITAENKSNHVESTVKEIILKIEWISSTYRPLLPIPPISKMKNPLRPVGSHNLRDELITLIGGSRHLRRLLIVNLYQFGERTLRRNLNSPRRRERKKKKREKNCFIQLDQLDFGNIRNCQRFRHNSWQGLGGMCVYDGENKSSME